jgi:aryl-alcohol dehydrogenase
MGASLVVFGLGAVGMSALMAAKLCGCDPLIAVDIRPTRLALARELGATHTIDAGTGDVPGQVRKITGDGAEFMVEAIGNPALVDGCVRALRSRSSGVLLGAPKAGAKLEFDSGNLLRGIELKSVVEGEAVPRVFIPQLVELHKQGRFPFDRLLRFYDFARINEAADAMSRGDAIKPVLIMPH